MRAFISAVVVAAIIAVCGAWVLNRFQEPAQVAFKTEAVRL